MRLWLRISAQIRSGASKLRVDQADTPVSSKSLDYPRAIRMRKFFILFSRALTLRCPACAGGPLFRHWLQVKSECPGCHLRLERDEGHFIGAMAFNLLVAEGSWVIGLFLALVLTWPAPPWTAI